MDLHTYNECLRAGDEAEFPVVLDAELEDALGWEHGQAWLALMPICDGAVVYSLKDRLSMDVARSFAITPAGVVMYFGQAIGNISQITLVSQDQAVA